jgi:hypothetical protein
MPRRDLRLARLGWCLGLVQCGTRLEECRHDGLGTRASYQGAVIPMRLASWTVPGTGVLRRRRTALTMSRATT